MTTDSLAEVAKRLADDAAGADGPWTSEQRIRMGLAAVTYAVLSLRPAPPVEAQPEVESPWRGQADRNETPRYGVGQQLVPHRIEPGRVSAPPPPPPPRKIPCQTCHTWGRKNCDLHRDAPGLGDGAEAAAEGM